MASEVTVVIPTRNRRPLLMRALHSVLTQRAVDLAVVVVDDGGTDGTGAAVDGLGNERVTCLALPASGGVSAARNAGLDLARSDWVAFLDDDDLWAPDKLRSQLDALAADGSAGWSSTGVLEVDERCRILAWDLPVPEHDVGDGLLSWNVVPGPGSSLVVSRRLALDVGGFDEALPGLEDWDFCIRLGLAAEVVPVQRAQVGYLIHRSSRAHDIDRGRAAFAAIEAKYAEERMRRGVRMDRTFWNNYLGSLAYRSGRPWLGSRLKLGPLVRYRRPGTLLEIMAGMSSIDLTGRAVRRARAKAPAELRAEAESWLAPYRYGRFE